MTKLKNKRNKEILRLKTAGWELQEIGTKLGISKQRVFQIIRQIQKDRRDFRRLKKKKII